MLQGTKIDFLAVIALWINLKKTLDALLLSTAEPISLKELVKLFARYHEELVEQAEDASNAEEDANEVNVPDKITELLIRDVPVALTDAAGGRTRVSCDRGSNGFQLFMAPQSPNLYAFCAASPAR